jgi:DNA polymerase III epsilon subunit family exonuclease
MGPFIFLDIETTGFDPNRNQIIEIAAIKWADFKILDRFESLVNPHIKLPQEISLLTGIRDNMVADSPRFSDIKEKFLGFASELPVVGHNIAFDLSFLKSHHAELPNPKIDTLALARILLRKEKSYALEVLMKKYGLPVRESHRAMADTETTLAFFEFLLTKIGEIPAPAFSAMKNVFQKSDWPGSAVFQPSL